MKKVNKHFISEIDKKFNQFDAEHPKSAHQLAEIKKYQRIHELRDKAIDALPSQPSQPSQPSHKTYP
jgi:hypothetical protein